MSGPARETSLRTVEQERYRVIDELTGEVIEEIEASMAFYQVYEGGIYLNQGKQYLVKKLDLENRAAYVRRSRLGYYTATRDYTEVCVKGGVQAYAHQRRPASIPPHRRTMANCTKAEVTKRFLGYTKISKRTGKLIDNVDLDLPDVKYETDAAWVRCPDIIYSEFKAYFPEKEYRAALHGASHAVLNVLPLYIMCLPSDCLTECDSPFDTRYRAQRLLIYDQQKDGSGIAYQASFMFSELIGAAVELIEACDCDDPVGCPGCIHHNSCGEYNAVLHKGGAALILRYGLALLPRRSAHRGQSTIYMAFDCVKILPLQEVEGA